MLLAGIIIDGFFDVRILCTPNAVGDNARVGGSSASHLAAAAAARQCNLFSLLYYA